MNKFHFFIDNPKSREAEKVAEHLPPAVLYASVDPVKNIRMMSKDLHFKHHIAFKSRHSIRTWLSGNEIGEIIAQVFHPDATYDLLSIPIDKYRYREYKEIKFNKYAAILCCPSCKGKLLRNL